MAQLGTCVRHSLPTARSWHSAPNPRPGSPSVSSHCHVPARASLEQRVWKFAGDARWRHVPGGLQMASGWPTCATGRSSSGNSTARRLPPARGMIPPRRTSPTQMGSGRPMGASSREQVGSLGVCQAVVERPDGSGRRVVTARPAEGTACPYAVAAWSPDGRRLLLMFDVSGLHFTMVTASVTDRSGAVRVVEMVCVNHPRSWPRRNDVSWQPRPS